MRENRESFCRLNEELDQLLAAQEERRAIEELAKAEARSELALKAQAKLKSSTKIMDRCNLQLSYAERAAI